MKLRQLQCFCTLADAEFNISRASLTLHATPPAIGKQLRQFEENLGTDLLVRQGGRILGLTEAGERALVWARRTLQCAGNLRASVQGSDAQTDGHIDLATNHTHAKYVLLPAIVAFARRFPRVRIGIQQGTPDQVAELVRDGKASAGISHVPPQLPKELIAIPFCSSQQVLCTPVGHPLMAQEELTLEKLAAYPLIVQSPAQAHGARILGKFNEAGVQVHVAVQALDSDIKKTYVAAGLGIAIIPAFNFSEELDKGLCVRDVGHLFGPSPSVILLRRRSYLPRFVYDFFEQLDPVLERSHIESLIFNES
jgi:LysR family cys regulon transcriptional activator